MTEPTARPRRPAQDADPVLARPGAGRPVVAFLLATVALTAAGIGQATSMPEPPPPVVSTVSTSPAASGSVVGDGR